MGFWGRVKQLGALPARGGQAFLSLLDWLGSRVLRLWRRHSRLLSIALILLLLSGSGVVAGLRYWILPNIDQYRPELTRALSRAIGQQVTLEQMQADWSGLHPRLYLKNLRILDAAGQPIFTLAAVKATLSWWSIPTLSPRFDSILLINPLLDLRYDAAGKIWLGGIWLNPPGPDRGVSDWLLAQHVILIDHAHIGWLDQKNKLPPVLLNQVSMRLHNNGNRHRFGLVGQVQDVTPHIDLRGDFRGRSLQDLTRWHGTLYSRIDQVGVAALQARLPFALPVRGGAGGVQSWLAVNGGRLTGVTANVLLQKTSGQLSGAAPFALNWLKGQVAWSDDAGRLKISSRQLALQMANGVHLSPTDFSLELRRSDKDIIQQGSLQANRLDAGELLAVASYVPLPDSLRQRIKELAPTGRLEEVQASWQGEWPSLQRYSLKAGFVRAGLAAQGVLPGARGVSGTLLANDSGGTLTLDSRASTVDLPHVFRRRLAFDHLRANLSWEKVGQQTEVHIGQVSFDNAALAGKVIGSYRTQANGPGTIDLTGNLFRAEASKVYEYLPTIINQDALDWLDHAFLAGRSSDVFLRLKGPLQDFPFADGKSGQFIAKVPIEGGRLHYGEGWPEFNNVQANLLFSGARMEVKVNHADVLGNEIKLADVVIPDLMSENEQLLVHGEAAGPLEALLTFVQQSPVHEMTRHFTDGMHGGGNGAVVLDIDMPLRHMIDATVKGQVKFSDNQITFASAIPALAHVRGQLDFDEHGIAAHNMQVQTLGGAAKLNVLTAAGAVQVKAEGKATAAGLQNYLAALPAGSLSGTAAWKAQLDITDLASLQVDSDLQGLGIRLPAPYSKVAATAMPFRLSMNQAADGTENWDGQLGKWATLRLWRSGDGKTPGQGVIQLGGGETQLNRSGIWLQGELPAFDLDAWRRLPWPGQSEDSAGIPLAGASLKFQQLDAAGRRFGPLAVEARHVDDSQQWNIGLNGQDMVGQLVWSGSAEGKLSGHFKRFAVPAAAPAQAAPAAPAISNPTPPQPQNSNLPVVDIVADQFDLGPRHLGRLAVMAKPVGTSWTIDNLLLSAPDYELSMAGTWDRQPRPGRTSVKVQMDIKDISSFLARIGFEGTVKRGKAQLAGQVSWMNEPASLDYASLTGELQLNAVNGQFLKIDPGVGKLLGILSLQALPRRITLDFRDIFSEGLAFDSIRGDMLINKGILTTDDFRIEGPAAKIEMRGKTDLAKETQDLTVHVQPTLSEGVSVAGGLIGGPAVGIASYVLQKVLKNPLEQIVGYEYHVSGTWSDPQVEKAKRTAVDSAPVDPINGN